MSFDDLSSADEYRIELAEERVIERADREISRLEAALAAAVRTGDGLNETLQQLAPLCPCGIGGPNPEQHQACPLHGDGVTFVAYVQRLETIERCAQAYLAVSEHYRGSTEFDALYDALAAS